MTKSKTVHVLPAGKEWAVKSEGRSESLHSTKHDAVAFARELVKSTNSGQIVVYKADGSIAAHSTYGLPKVQRPPRKSRLGTKKIERVVSKVVLSRLGPGPLSPRAKATV